MGPLDVVPAVGDPGDRRVRTGCCSGSGAWSSTRTPGTRRVDDGPVDPATQRLLHKTIDGVREDMETLRFNTSIAS